MGTKPPPDVKQAPEDSIETIAYKSVKDIPTHEPNDRHRLGYHVWLWLTENSNSSLDEKITVSGARLLISEEEAKKHIIEKLKSMNVEMPDT